MIWDQAIVTSANKTLLADSEQDWQRVRTDAEDKAEPEY